MQIGLRFSSGVARCHSTACNLGFLSHRLVSLPRPFQAGGVRELKGRHGRDLRFGAHWRDTHRTYTFQASSTQVAAPGDFVKVHYTGTLDNGETFDSSRGREPLAFILGEGEVIQGFDDAVSGLGLGETRKQRIPAERAYGEWKEELTAEIPRTALPPAASGLVEGNMVRMANGLTARVTKVTDDSITIDCNPALAGQPLTFDVELVELVKEDELQKATFGAGCFWGPELAFQRVPGVVATCVGYSQGDKQEPTYEEVCSGDTGHAEVVQVVYNSKEVSYKDLLDTFWNHHNPTQLNRQGNDVGTQYRSGIYVHSPEQREFALASKEERQASLKEPIVTEVEEIKNFFKAEPYHQSYLARGGRNGNPQNPAKGCTDPIRCYG
eukprot:jgi/Botrbrau1/3505/Bobra.341_2s0034.1